MIYIKANNKLIYLKKCSFHKNEKFGVIFYSLLKSILLIINILLIYFLF